MRIVLLSDTHSYFDPAMIPHLEAADEIWHAGDIGDLAILEKLSKYGPIKSVYGNIDNHEIRSECPEYRVENIYSKKILMIHIAGPLGKYNPKVRRLIEEHRPDILVCGHSHILKVQFDQRYNLLYINPGAVGHHGFHVMRTLINMEGTEKGIEKMEVVELGRRGRIS